MLLEKMHWKRLKANKPNMETTALKRTKPTSSGTNEKKTNEKRGPIVGTTLITM